MNNKNPVIGNRICQTSQKRRMSQEELANLSGIGKATLYRLERDERNPSIQAMTGMAETLDVIITDLTDVGDKNYQENSDEYLSCKNTNDLSVDIGSRIRLIRQKNKISQVELADLSGINKATLCRLEKGERNPSIETIFRLAEAMNVMVTDLIDVNGGYFQESSDNHLSGEVLKYMKKLTIDKQKDLLEIVKIFCRSKLGSVL